MSLRTLGDREGSIEDLLKSPSKSHANTYQKPLKTRSKIIQNHPKVAPPWLEVVYHHQLYMATLRSTNAFKNRASKTLQAIFLGRFWNF